MGLPPELPDYTPGVACPSCEATLFGGVTPLYVEAHVQGVIECPGLPTGVNGVILLTQGGPPCNWVFNTPAIFWRWTIGPAGSEFAISTGGALYFTDPSGVNCRTTFTNTSPGCVPFVFAGHGGTVEVFWGPTIGP